MDHYLLYKSKYKQYTIPFTILSFGIMAWYTAKLLDNCQTKAEKIEKKRRQNLSSTLLEVLVDIESESPNSIYIESEGNCLVVVGPYFLFFIFCF